MLEAFRQTLTISLFVFVMMVAIEYANVIWQGAWQRRLAADRWSSYLLAGLLGALPGCLGAFAVVAMYSHRVLTIGAVVTAMIATSGDEAFVLLAMAPGTALFLTGLLFAIGVAAGALTDAAVGRRTSRRSCAEGEFSLHAEHEDSRVSSWPQILRQWHECVAARGLLAGGLLALLGLVAAGAIGPASWNWLRLSLMGVTGIALGIVFTAPDHFLEEHLWKHVVRQHLPRIFLWTFGALALMSLFPAPVERLLSSRAGLWGVLLIACLVGIVPESGPHLVFVTLFAQGALPFSILLANSIVQDGHGMLPMLAHSRRAFLAVKAVNLLVGIAVGALALASGY
jgi:hypothetical protein